jgi:hypothetical protein
MGDNIERTRRSRPKLKLFQPSSIDTLICLIHNLQVRRGYKNRGPEIAVIGIVFNMASSLRNPCSWAELCLLAAFRLLLTGLARQSRNRNSNRYFTTEAQSSQSSEYLLIKNSLLRALRASAVSSPNYFSPQRRRVRRVRSIY